MTMKIAVVCDVPPCSLVNVYDVSIYNFQGMHPVVLTYINCLFICHNTTILQNLVHINCV
jgi:hypothetical protein